MSAQQPLHANTALVMGNCNDGKQQGHTLCPGSPWKRHCLGRYYRRELRIALASLGFAAGFFYFFFLSLPLLTTNKVEVLVTPSVPCMRCKEVKGRVCKQRKAHGLDVFYNT